MFGTDVDVIVVGAGVAGLACGESLARAGARFVILEASERLGGRLWTDYSLAGGAPVETGALMIHGRHVATQHWVREVGCHVRSLPVLQRSVFFRNRRPATLPAMALPFHPTFGTRAVIQAGWSIPRATRRAVSENLTLAELMDQMGVVPGARSIATFLHAHINVADPDQIGARALGQEEPLSQEGWIHHFQVLEGYSEVVRRRAHQLSDRIRVNSRVYAVRSRPSGVEVEFETQERRGSLTARAAVVTVPLGVLKANLIEFDPPLPGEKRRAISAIGFGPVMETILRLRGGNLRDRLGEYAMLWGNTSTSFDRPFVGLQGRPDILSAFTAGREAGRRSALPDREVVDATLEELQSFLPFSLRVGEVETYLIRRWPQNEFVRGGYSFLPPGAGVPDRAALAASVDGRLFFAGEATHATGEPATVHGAIETGYRAAAQVLQALHSA